MCNLFDKSPFGKLFMTTHIHHDCSPSQDDVIMESSLLEGFSLVESDNLLLFNFFCGEYVPGTLLRNPEGAQIIHYGRWTGHPQYEISF